MAEGPRTGQTTHPQSGPLAALSNGSRRAFLVRVQKSRAIVYATGILVAVGAKFLGEFQLTWQTILLFGTVSCGSAAVFGWIYSAGFTRLLGISIQSIYMAIDVLLFGWIMFLTGGSESYWFPWALSSVAAAAFVVGRLGVAMMMIANMSVYIGVVLISEQPDMQTLLIIVMRIAILYAAAVFGLMGICRLQEKRRVISSLRAQEKQQAAEIAESEEQHRKLFESAPTPYLLVDPNSRKIIAANLAAAALCALPDSEIVGHTPEDLHLDWLRDALDRIVQPGRTPPPGDMLVEFLRADGETQHLEVRVQSIAFERVRHILVSAQDVTARRRLLDEQMRSSKLESLGLLAGGVAHDFNNILAAVIGNISLAKMKAPEGAGMSKELDAAESALVRATQLTHQLLTFARGGKPVKKLSDLAKITRESVAFAAAGSQSRCSFELPADLWHAEVSEAQISQVISNLVLNAEQAGPAGSCILLRGENIQIRPASGLPLDAGAYVKITVEDCGTGIPHEIRDKIFDPYFTTKENGTGLGLSTAYAIIRNHGGHIQIESRPGAGTSAAIYLQARPEAVLKDIAYAQTPPRGRAKILVMDDEPDLRSLYKAVLGTLGYRVTAVGEGGEAVKEYLDAKTGPEPFDCVIMDLTVPGGMGGKQAIDEIRQRDPHVKAIVVSGYTNDPVLADFRRAGFLAAIPKPFSVAELARTLHEIVAANGVVNYPPSSIRARSNGH